MSYNGASRSGASRSTRIRTQHQSKRTRPPPSSHTWTEKRIRTPSAKSQRTNNAPLHAHRCNRSPHTSRDQRINMVKVVMCSLALLICSGTASAWLSGYDHRMNITVNNGGGSTLNYYQFNFTNDTNVLVAAGHMQADGADCRVTDSADNHIPFWNETAFNASGTRIYANATLTTGDNIFHMYYGNSGASSAVDPTTTFEFFDGFERWGRCASNPVLNNSSATRFDDNFVATPCVVQNGTASEYFMYYTGGMYPCTSDHKCRESAGLAISTDLITWTKYNGSGTNDRILECGISGDFDYWRTWGMGTTIRESATSWKIWYTGDSDSSPAHVARIGYATSPDGKTWTKYIGSGPGNCTFEDMDGASSGSRGAMQPAVIKINDTHYKMWYKIYQSGKIKYATSTDGITWDIQNNNNSVIAGSEGILTLGDVRLVGDTYYLIASHSSYTKFSTWTSTNCINWTKHADEMLSSASGWDSLDMYSPSFFQKHGETNKWYLFYSAGYTSGDEDERIGFATINRTIPLANIQLGEWTMADGSNIQSSVVKSGSSAMELLDNSGVSGHRGGIEKTGFTLGNRTLEYDYMYPAQDIDICQPVVVIKDASDIIYWFGETDTNRLLYEWLNPSAINSSFSGGDIPIPFGDGTWYKMSHSFYSSSPYLGLAIDNVDKGTGGLYHASYQSPIMIWMTGADSSGTGTIGWMDNVRIRKYTATEPTSLLGAEEDAPATTYTVCASGCDYTTIQAAEDAASAGDTVYVYNGTYAETVNIANASVTFTGEGRDVVTVNKFLIYGDYANVSGFTMNGATLGSYGIYLSADHCNVMDNTICSNVYHGVYVRYADYCNVRNNTIESNAYHGIYIRDSSNNVFTNNTVETNLYYGVYIRNSFSNELTDNMINSNLHYGVYMLDSASNTLTDNTINSNIYYGIYLSNASSNTLTTNTAAHNMRVHSPLLTDSQEGTVGNQIDFNFTMKNMSDVDCPTCSYVIELHPSEASLQYSKAGSKVSGYFTPTREGIYSLRVNVSDGSNHDIRKYIFLINATSSETIDYYFRHVLATHGQPATYGTDYDAGSLLFDAPISDEEVWCGGYVGLSIDALPDHLFGIFTDINYSIWYSIAADGYTGIQRYGDLSMDVDESTVVTTTATKFESFNFSSVNWANDYFWMWYRVPVKLKGNTPYIYSNQTHLSYANITYLYPTTPSIEGISNTDILLLSATSPASDDTQASIIIDGTGSTYLVVQMPNTALTYTATWDGGACTGGACSFTQSSGELNFTLTLGSEHTIAITESGSTNNISLAANTYGFLCEDPSIAHPFDMIAPEFDHEVCFLWLNNSGECWESYWSGDAYNSDLSIPANDAYFVLMDGTGETVSCGVRAAGNVAIPTGWYATYLGESTAKTLTQIKTDMQVDGTVTNLYTWDHNAGGTGAWISVDVTPSHSVLPNQGILINNMGAPYNWDGTVS